MVTTGRAIEETRRRRWMMISRWGKEDGGGRGEGTGTETGIQFGYHRQRKNGINHRHDELHLTDTEEYGPMPIGAEVENEVHWTEGGSMGEVVWIGEGITVARIGEGTAGTSVGIGIGALVEREIGEMEIAGDMQIPILTGRDGGVLVGIEGGEVGVHHGLGLVPLRGDRATNCGMTPVDAKSHIHLRILPFVSSPA